MKLIKTEDAEGHVLCHDITQIIPGVIKDAVFRKGHIVTKEDIPVLLSIGKENLYVWEKTQGMLHEDEAAEILKKICIGNNSDDLFISSSPKEGKIEIKANCSGLLKIDDDRLMAINSLGEMMIASVHGNFYVKKGDKICATRIIPLIIDEKKMENAKKIAGDKPLFSIIPLEQKKTVIITTGSEVAKGRIEDCFGPVVKAKLAELDVPVIEQIILLDEQEAITYNILKSIENGAEMVICTGGMSVDPDDRTPGAIKATGADIISYGAPILPGAMFLLSYIEQRSKKIPVLGLPGCVMYAKRTVFDLLLPRILANDNITASDISRYGQGGLCLNCETCHFPNCGFGK